MLIKWYQIGHVCKCMAVRLEVYVSNRKLYQILIGVSEYTHMQFNHFARYCLKILWE